VLVHRRGIYMQEAVAPGVGKMVAVLGKEVSELEEVIAACTLKEVDIANINAPGQIVVSGTNASINEFLTRLPNTKYVELPVSAPFHSRLMRPAAERLSRDLATITVREPEFPVVSNVTAQPHTTPEEIRKLLAEQVCARVRWTECMQTIQERFPVTGGREYGSGRVLTGLMKRINRSFQVVSVSDQATIVALGGDQAA
jgi:[acyl-carrier-protein] S-malonyltransferase